MNVARLRQPLQAPWSKASALTTRESRASSAYCTSWANQVAYSWALAELFVIVVGRSGGSVSTPGGAVGLEDGAGFECGLRLPVGAAPGHDERGGDQRREPESHPHGREPTRNAPRPTGAQAPAGAKCSLLKASDSSRSASRASRLAALRVLISSTMWPSKARPASSSRNGPHGITP